MARHLADYITKRAGHTLVPGIAAKEFNWTAPERRKTTAVGNIGGDNLPVVISSRIDGDMEGLDNPDMKPDYIYTSQKLPEKIDPKQKYIVDFNVFDRLKEDMRCIGLEENIFPVFSYRFIPFLQSTVAKVKFLIVPYGAPSEEYIPCLKANRDVVAVAISHNVNTLGEQRAFAHELMNEGIKNPIVFCYDYRFAKEQKGDFQIEAAADLGPLLFDGLTDGIWLMNLGTLPHTDIETTSFAILQAARLRTTKTEYISCPGCGRTLYDLRTTIARIKQATSHMKGLKIGIMGCIVNGPGEMADADYGYVGAGRGKVSLYRRKECVEKNIPEEEAVEKLLELIDREEKKKK